MNNMLLIAVGIGFVYYLAYMESPWVQYFFKEAIVIGAVVGLIMGDFKTGLMMGGNFQILYIAGVMAPGGNLSVDSQLACCIAIPVAMASGMGVEEAMVLSVPFGVLGVFLDNIRRTIMGFWTRRADKHALEGNTKAIMFDGIGGPLIFNIFLRWIPVAVIVYMGVDAATAIVNAIPEWLMEGFKVAGGMLPATGLALILVMLNKPMLLVYYVLAVVLTQLLSMPIVAAAVIGGVLAILHVTFTTKAEEA
ncbi:PTS sugar transporter subunit IIC [Mediterraneibacter sp. NSJ-55]|uniref:PTS sugar transporter subunit IIC n=1 Tax=Mediterraneibacter hominis TaxID=2763054 RepID=A0A923LJW9_9FIRM|nr:PTS sugar transporter subunit IIC [Mediterraneibacter hominis]MBC5689316.1 PTS sugar transporter subunit IIC [Mediterraneibacter hominis]